MTDLVRRLRVEAGAGWTDDLSQLFKEAADAIEHLASPQAEMQAGIPFDSICVSRNANGTRVAFKHMGQEVLGTAPRHIHFEHGDTLGAVGFVGRVNIIATQPEEA